MLSKRLLRMTEWRLYFIELTCFTPIAWDWKTHSMKPSRKFAYWNWLLQLFYMFSYMTILIVKLFIKYRGNPDGDIPDEVVTKKDEAYDAMLTAIDVGFISSLAIILGLSINLIRARQDLICLFNKLVELDSTLTEKYESELQGNPTVKEYCMRASMRVELTMAAINFITVIVVPGMFVFGFLQDYEPVHRFFAEVFEIHITLKPSHIPFLLGMMLYVGNCANTCFFYALACNWNIHVICFWLMNTTPQTSQITYTKQGYDSAPLFSTRLGLMEGSVIMTIYKRLQFLDRLADNLLTSFMITIHHGGEMIAFVACSYICITYSGDLIHTPGLIVLIFVPIIVTFEELIETVELCRIHDTSRATVVTLKDSFRRSYASRKYRKSKELWKKAQAAPVLWMETAYPFYRYHKGTFIEFFHQTIDLLVSVLVG
ncbi:unnamed protein product [Orchesella dallaii]|uniref:Odorant receptor n=1 Tax=Orchesella dallaii TaxID=48710 RepID=A0ABP1QM02_9HEXA